MNKKQIKIALLILGVLLTIILVIAIVLYNHKDDAHWWVEPIIPEEELVGLDDDSIEGGYEVKTEINIQSKEVLDLIENNWDISKVNFGTRESTFDEYDIYFDEGIEVKTVAGKVFNIVFTEKYTGEIVNNLTTKSSERTIIDTLGEIQFYRDTEELVDYDEEMENNEETDENSFLIGYKSNQIYVFFSEIGVSVYPVIEIEDKNEIETVYEAIVELEENKDIDSFLANIKEIWNDFDYYYATDEFVDIVYALKGFEIMWNPYSNKIIKLYENVPDDLLYYCSVDENIEKISVFNLNPESNLIFIKEIERYDNNQYIPETAGLDMDLIKESNKSNLFKIAFEYVRGERESIKIMCMDKSYPNREIKGEDINSIIWYDDTTFYYSIKNRALYKYNCITGEGQIILNENREYEIKKIEDGYLYFDDVRIKI